MNSNAQDQRTEDDASSATRNETRATNLVITVPHASNELPHWMSDVADTTLWEKLRLEHWASDRNAGYLAEALVAGLGARVVLGDVSRLAIDLNRDLRDCSVIPLNVPVIGQLDFNTSATAADLAARWRRHACFHVRIQSELSAVLSNTAPAFLIDLHTFDRFGPTDTRREVDIGICAPGISDFAFALLQILMARTCERAADKPVDPSRAVLNVRLDEPYSANHPGAYVTRRHSAANVHGVVIEVCDEVLDPPDSIQPIAALLCAAIRDAAAQIIVATAAVTSRRLA